MSNDQASTGNSIRLWPGVLAVALQWLGFYAVPLLMSGPEAGYIAPVAGLLGGVAVAVWWALFSRGRRAERWGAILLTIAALATTSLLLHESIAGGMMGLMFLFFAIPFLSLAFVLWAIASRGLAAGPRRATMVATILLACGAWTLLRSDGITGGGSGQFSLRWTPTSEERLLARDEPTEAAKAPEAVDAEPEWPGFRGPERNGVVSGVWIETDWVSSPPAELWRRSIGPGWSSFAVGGGLIYTQEQRGEEEVVACYSAATGKPVWRHSDPARFYEALGGAGPRGTPTLHGGRVYALGATGVLNALDAADGSVMWSRNVAKDADQGVPYWGFASSPLVIEDLVVVAAAGRAVAYDLASGDLRWLGPKGGGGYSSPHRATIDGVEQILLMSGAGAVSVSPADGKRLWADDWSRKERIVQPAVTPDGDLLLSAGESTGLRRVRVTKESGRWSVEERWTTKRLKPYFNDFVVHSGHAFGFDGRILACVDLEDGERKWKGGRYGTGQMALLPEQDLLLVLTEQGELALVEAKAEAFVELARVPGIDGKTWNHPVVVGDIVFVRNAEEMAAFRLPTRPTT